MMARLARAAYAALFVVALPAGLWLWAARLDAWLALPLLHWPRAGAALVAGGAALALAAARALWVHGGGLPASPFPPARLVSRGPYRVVAHPLYLGAVTICLGVALATGSPGGVWIVTPTFAAAIAAWVIGFERDHTRQLFGALPAPLLRLPDDGKGPPTGWQRAAVYAFVLVPWLVLYLAIELLGAPPDARSAALPWERAIPVIPWTEGIYAATYPLVVLAPLVARGRRDLRSFARDGLWSMAFVLPLYLLVPLVVTARPIPGDGFWQALMRAERALDGPVTAFPAYHVVWTLIAARVYAARWPAARWPLAALAVAVAASCLTTGMHAVADVLAGLAAYALVRHRGAVWGALRRGAERVAGSWREWELGPVRLLSHGVYAGLGAALGVGLAAKLAGPSRLPWLLAMTAGAIVGAALWAQLVEGSPQLLRPYGYFGAVAGTLLGVAAAAAAGADAWLLLVSFGIGTTVAQAVGRLRCLVQGCCHGATAPPAVGIVYRHPRSRVVRLSGQGGVPLHPTQLYSLLWMLVVGAVLLRLWAVAAPLPFVAGAYFLLVGLGRFVEEHHRGEPQTRVVGGLRLYQWLAITFVIGGAALTAVRGPAAPVFQPVDPRLLPALAAVALVAYAAYGIDLPRSSRRFSRLV